MVLSPLRSFIITVLTATIIKLCCFDSGAGSVAAQREGREDVGSRSSAATKRRVYHDGTQSSLFLSVLYLWVSQDPNVNIQTPAIIVKKTTCILHGSVGEESANSGATELVARRQRLL